MSLSKVKVMMSGQAGPRSELRSPDLQLDELNMKPPRKGQPSKDKSLIIKGLAVVQNSRELNLKYQPIRFLVFNSFKRIK